MVKGQTKSQPTKNASKKSIPAGGKQPPTSSPNVLPSKGKSVKLLPGQIPSCCACGILIGDDVKALQCDRCSANESWKCAECLNIPADMYDHLVSDPNCSLRWFCLSCDKSAMSTDKASECRSTDKIDNLIALVEKLLDKLSMVENKMDDKCDVALVNQLTNRVQDIEDRTANQAQELNCKLTSLEQKLKTHLDEKITSSLSEVVQSDNGGRCDELQKKVQEEITKKIDQDKDLEKRKMNIIIYKAGEADSNSVSDRNSCDLAFVTELLDCVFKIQPAENGVLKTFRLGSRDKSQSGPRPLLVVFNSVDAKEAVMSKLKYLKDAVPPFKGISLAHDLPPWERAEIKNLVDDAKKEHINTSPDSVENYWFRVVGRGSRKRIKKIPKQIQTVQ